MGHFTGTHAGHTYNTLESHGNSSFPSQGYWCIVLLTFTQGNVCFAVGDLQQLLSVCLVRICPTSSSFCPAAEVYAGCHLDGCSLDIRLACLLC